MSQTTQENFSLQVKPRPVLGKNAAYRARVAKSVPAVVYGPNMKTPVSVHIDPALFVPMYRKVGRTGLITLQTIEGAEASLNGTKVLVKDLQTHPLKNTLLHVDFHQIDLKKAIRMTVPLNFIGKAKGLADGGLMSISARQVEIRVLPTEIPNHIDVDVSDLGVTDSIHISELAKKMEGSKFEFMYESDYALVAVVRPEDEKAAEPAANWRRNDPRALDGLDLPAPSAQAAD